MENFYRNLLIPYTQKIAEVKKSYNFLTERHLQAAWLEQRHFQNLKTSEGIDIQVISSGIWNLNAGPDFLKAHLIIGGREIKGDIEIHFSSSDWYHHRHHEDPRYNQVILHVVLWKPKASKPIWTQSHHPVSETYLEESLTIPYEKLARLIDFDLYPYQIFSGGGKCSKQLFNELSMESTRNFFRSAAAWRLLEKYSYISNWVEDPLQYFGGGAAMALGYKNNTETFLRLFLYLYPLKNRGEEGLLAVAMGITGFFRSAWQQKWGNSEFYRYLHSLYLMQTMVQPCEPHYPLIFLQVRPLNHPLRRLVTLVKLICDPDIGRYFALLDERWKASWPQLANKGNWNLLKKQWLDLLPDYPDAHWNYHFAFEEGKKTTYLSLLGAPIKQEIIKNTVLPLLYHQISQRGHLKELTAFFNFYGSLTASNRNKLNYLKHRFFGQASKGKLLSTADIEQGAYQLHKDFCLHYEASCEGCPFIEKFLTHQHSMDITNC